MNQKVVIYIILSAILLYLYYRKKDFTIFVAFAVVAGATLIFRSATIGEEGFSIGGGGGGGGGDKECAKLGFKPPKIQKKNWKKSLVTTLKNIQKVAEKHWPFEGMTGDKPNNDAAKKNFSMITNNAFYKEENAKIRKDENKQDIQMKFIGGAAGLYEAFIKSPSDKNKEDVVKDLNSEFVTKAIKGGEMVLEILKKNHENLKKEYKAGGLEMETDLNNLSRYLICLCKQWITIWKALQKAKFGDENDDKGDDDEGDDDEGEDDEEAKPKKKKNKSTKKKSKKDDADDDNDEE
jgi:hypothetical protein